MEAFEQVPEHTLKKFLGLYSMRIHLRRNIPEKLLEVSHWSIAQRNFYLTNYQVVKDLIATAPSSIFHYM